MGDFILDAEAIDPAEAAADAEVADRLRASLAALPAREARIVAALRREKIERLYGPWLQQLKQRYPSQINQERWQRLISSGFSS